MWRGKKSRTRKAIGSLVGTLLLFVAVVAGWNWWHHLRIHGYADPFTFTSSDGTVLVGEVRLPEGPGPYPAVVILHGSGPGEVSMIDNRWDANTFLKKGHAVLLYDKRGAGRSGGDFATATYADFTADILAAVEALRARPDIADDRIGLFAISEGAWFAPEVAVRDGNIRFVIMRSGSPEIVHLSYRWEIRNELIAAGVTDETLIDRLLDLRLRIWEYYRDAAAAASPLPERREELETEREALAGPWREVYSLKIAEYDLDKFRRWVVDLFYDPTPYLAALDAPLLAVYGARDQNVPAEASIAVLTRLRETAGKQIDIEVYPGRDHYLMKWYNLFTMGLPPGHFELIGEWAARHSD